MSLWSLYENGDLEGVKVALGRGELDEVTCMEKAAFVVAALRSKKNEAVITLMKHLGFDHAQHTNSFGSFIEGMENRSILQSLHSRCLPRHTVGMKSEKSTAAKINIARIANAVTITLYSRVTM